MVCGIKDHKDEIWDHSPGIRVHKPWDRDRDRDQKLRYRDQKTWDQRSQASHGIGITSYGIRDQKLQYRDHKPRDQGSEATVSGSQATGSESAVFLEGSGISVLFLWDQGQNLSRFGIKDQKFG